MANYATSFLTIIVLHCWFLSWQSQATDTLKPGEDLREAKTLVSSNGVFELGLFSSDGTSSSSHYLGIWFKNDPNQKPVWVGNREYPLMDSSGILSIRYDGNLVIQDRRQIPIIVNSGMLALTNDTIAILLDSGNLLLKEGDIIVWQSFYYPSDTFLPGMKIGRFNLGTQHLRKQFLVSWQSSSVPATGSFALGLDSVNATLLMIWNRQGASRQVGFWDGQGLKLIFKTSSDDYNFSFVSNTDEVYLTFDAPRSQSSSWFTMSSNGQIQEYKMVGQSISVVNHSICEHTTGSDATECYEMTPSRCRGGDTFSEITGSLPNSVVVNDSVHLGLSDCEILCRGNCSCTAYASFRNDGTGCEFYYGDTNVLPQLNGEGKGTIYIRGETPKSGRPRCT